MSSASPAGMVAKPLLGGGVDHVEGAAPGRLDPRAVDVQTCGIRARSGRLSAPREALRGTGHRMTGLRAHDGVDGCATASTHQRIPTMPGQVPPVPDKRTGLLAFLAQQRDVIKLTAYGLSDDEARLAPGASPLSVGGLVKHAATTERGWIDLVVQRDRGATQDDYEENFSLQPDETLADVFDLYDEIAARNRSRRRRRRRSRPGRAGSKGSAVVSRRRRRVVGAVGAVAPDLRDRPPRRPRRHRARVDRRRHRVPAHGGSGRWPATEWMQPWEKAR